MKQSESFTSTTYLLDLILVLHYYEWFVTNKQLQIERRLFLACVSHEAAVKTESTRTKRCGGQRRSLPYWEITVSVDSLVTRLPDG